MGIDTVTGHSDDVADFVEKTQRAMHAEVERANALAARVVELESALLWASDEAKGRLPDWWHDVVKKCGTNNFVPRTQLEAEKRANAALHDASEARHARLRIANAHLSRLAAIVRTNCDEGKLHGFAAGTGTGLALRLALEHSTDDFVPRAEMERVQREFGMKVAFALEGVPVTRERRDQTAAIVDAELKP